MTEKMQFAVAYASIIFLKKKNQMLSAVNTGYVLPPNRAIGLIYLQKKAEKYDEKNYTKTFDGKQKSLVMRKSAFCNCAAD